MSFGPEQIWTPDQDALSGLFACPPPATFTCVGQVMKSSGASPDAIAFYGLTGWFLTDLEDADAGPVQLGTILLPWRANENTQSALLGGYPPVIYPEREMPPDAETSAAFTAVKQAHPNALLWQSSPTLKGTDTSPQGGQRFIFSYRILDGCHACAVLGAVRVAFDFAPDGTYDLARVLT